MNKVLFFNPRSAEAKHRFPNSIMAVAASIDNPFEWALVDVNWDNDPFAALAARSGNSSRIPA